MNGIHPRWADLCGQVAAWVASDFPDVYKTDIEDDLVRVISENPRLREDPPEDENYNYISELRRIGTEYALGQRADDLFRTSQYTYRRTDLVRLLRALFSYEHWDDVQLPVDSRSFENRGVDRVEVMSDISRAYSRLDIIDRRILFRCYGLLEEYAGGSTERKAVDRATRHLAEELNGFG